MVGPQRTSSSTTPLPCVSTRSIQGCNTSALTAADCWLVVAKISFSCAIVVPPLPAARARKRSPISSLMRSAAGLHLHEQIEIGLDQLFAAGNTLGPIGAYRFRLRAPRGRLLGCQRQDRVARLGHSGLTTLLADVFPKLTE